jgi:hypothetical protein
VNGDGATNISDAQMELREALAVAKPVDDLNGDGVVDVVDIETVIDAVLKDGCPADNSPPSVSGITPASGVTGATMTVSLAGAGLWGAVYKLQSVDPLASSGASSITAVSQTGTAATITVVLGAQGPYHLIVTNVAGSSAANSASFFMVQPVVNNVSFYASVLNTKSTLPGMPPLPAGENDAAFYVSVLNSQFNFSSAVSWMPVAASIGLSVCNTDSGCTAMSPATVALTAPRPLAATSAAASSLPPVLDPLEAANAGVTAGQTIRLAARNVDAASKVEFEVNQAVIATVTDAPYETLFTVPDGPAELAFRIVVEAPDRSERASPIVWMTVAPDSGADISGAVAPGAGGIQLSLAAGGLKAEFFHLAQPVTGLPSLTGIAPARVAYVTAINQPNPRAIFGDDPLGAHLGADYAVRFSGEVRADAPGEYRFWIAARSGAALFIDRKLLADSGFVSGEPAETPVEIELGSRRRAAGAKSSGRCLSVPGWTDGVPPPPPMERFRSRAFRRNSTRSGFGP